MYFLQAPLHRIGDNKNKIVDYWQGRYLKSVMSVKFLKSVKSVKSVIFIFTNLHILQLSQIYNF